MSEDDDRQPHPNARAHPAGAGAFRGAPTPGPITNQSTVQIRKTIQLDSSAAKNRSEIVKNLEKRIRSLKSDVGSKTDFRELKRKIEQQGGTWRAPNGLTFGLTKEGWVYQFLSEPKQGVAQTTIVALDADPPFVAVLHLDFQFVPPEKRKAYLKEMMDMAKRRKPPKPQKPTASTPNPAGPEIIVVVDKDWLSKRSLARWGTIEWHRHLKPTQLTLAARAKKGQKFHEDLIYPGDTFEVISSAAAGSGSP